MIDWFSVLFHCHFFINSPGFSHMVFRSLLTKGILFQHMHLQSNHMSLGDQELLQKKNLFCPKINQTLK